MEIKPFIINCYLNFFKGIISIWYPHLSVWSKTSINTDAVGGQGGTSHLLNGEKFYYAPDTNWAIFQQFPIKWRYFLEILLYFHYMLIRNAAFYLLNKMKKWMKILTWSLIWNKIVIVHVLNDYFDVVYDSWVSVGSFFKLTSTWQIG